MADDLNENLKGSKEEAAELKGIFDQLAQAIKDYASTLKGTKNFTSEINASLNEQIRSARKLANLSERDLMAKGAIANVDKEIEKLNNRIQSNKVAQANLDKTRSAHQHQLNKNQLELNKAILNGNIQRVNYLKQERTQIQGTLTDLDNASKLIYESTINTKALQNEWGNVKKELETINRKSKFFSNLEGMISKLPVLNKLLGPSFQQAAEASKRAAIEGKGYAQSMAQGSNALMKSLKEGINLTSIFSLLVKLAMDVDKHATGFERKMKMTHTEASFLVQEMHMAASLSGDLAVRGERMVESQNNLSEATGLMNLRSMDTLITFTKLTEKIGLSAKSAAGLEMMSKVMGKNFDQQRKDTAMVVNHLAASKGLLVDESKIMEEVGQTTGQVAANLGNNPVEIAKAVTQAQVLGTTLDKVAASANKLLDFEGSISQELEAELLVGRDLNLERARALALAGDQAGFAKEVASQMGSLSEFQKLNVIQQNKLAEAFGMSADEMGDMLFKQQYNVETAEKARALGNEELAQRMEARTLAQDMNDLILKLQSFLQSLVAGPLGTIAGMLASFMESWAGQLTAVGLIAALLASKVIGAVNTISSNFKSAAAGAKKMVGFLKQGRLQMIAINALNKMGLITDEQRSFWQGKYTFLKNKEKNVNLQNRVYENASFANLLKRVAIKVKDIALTKASNLLEKIGIGITAAHNVVKKVGKNIAKSELLTQIAGMAISAYRSAAAIPGIGWILGFVAAAAAAAIGAYYYSKADDMISPGYGKRTLLGPEGAIALNNKDTVIAGTDLFKKGDDVVSSPKGSVQLPDLAPPPPPPPAQPQPVVVSVNMNPAMAGTQTSAFGNTPNSVP
jgi:hypothetical protein